MTIVDTTPDAVNREETIDLRAFSALGSRANGEVIGY